MILFQLNLNEQRPLSLGCKIVRKSLMETYLGFLLINDYVHHKNAFQLWWTFDIFVFFLVQYNGSDQLNSFLSMKHDETCRVVNEIKIWDRHIPDVKKKRMLKNLIDYNVLT